MILPSRLFSERSRDQTKIVNEVKAKLIKEDKSWDIFFNGTEEQREAAVAEIQRSLYGGQ